MDSDSGQVFSMDVIAAFTISLLSLGALLTAWDFGKTRMDESERIQELEGRANALSDILVKTPGSPPWWESDTSPNATSIGLSCSDRVISPEKVAALGRMDNSRARDAFRAGEYRYHITLRTGDGKIIALFGEPVAGGFAATSTRVVTYLNRTSFIDVTVWGERHAGGVE